MMLALPFLIPSLTRLVGYGCLLSRLRSSIRSATIVDQVGYDRRASMAFAAARSIDKEFRKDCIWIPIAGYAAATAIGVERVISDRHHWYDVAAGAAIAARSCFFF